MDGSGDDGCGGGDGSGAGGVGALTVCPSSFSFVSLVLFFCLFPHELLAHPRRKIAKLLLSCVSGKGKRCQ